MTYVCLVRHGQSFGNENLLYSGRSEDHELTRLGVSQAEKTSDQLAQYKFDEIHSSNLIRAVATAQIIKMGNLYPPEKWFISESLNERYYGTVSGRTRTEVETQFGAKIVKSWSRTLNAAPPSGQNLFQVYAQVKDYFKKEIEPKLGEKSLLIVTHMHITRALTILIEELPISEMTSTQQIPNAQPILYEF